MTTQVVNIRTDEYDVRIDRRSPWGNPFKIGPDGDRDDVIRKFREAARWWPDAKKKQAVRELRGKRLACWCAPLPCHGKALAELIEEWRHDVAVSIRFACNDEKSGACLNRFDAARVCFPWCDGEEMELWGPTTRWREINPRLATVGRIRVPVRGVGQWVGNWCWDAIYCGDLEARHVCEYLHARGFVCDGGPCDLADAWSVGDMDRIFSKGGA